jgi:predicted outer membrane protein
MYTAGEIESVLWNIFNLEAEAIELTDENDGCYMFNVYPTDDGEVADLATMAQELHDSDLFDVTMKRDHLEVEYLNPYVLERYQFRLVHESVSKKIEFSDDKIKMLKQRFDKLYQRYHDNPFFKSVMNQLETKKKLSQRQYDELKFLIDNGKSRYEMGVLSTKY